MRLRVVSRDLPRSMSEEKPSAASVLEQEVHDLSVLRDTIIEAAGVCATMWVSYLRVLLYLFIAAGEVTHRDLFLESPVKLPFLNVDLALVGFFIFGPGLLLVVHLYVLIHFVLLADKVSVFRAQMRVQITHRPARTRLLRLLPSNIFLQLLAGPRETMLGALGTMLRLIALLTLVASPVALLIFFQLQFLPFHHEAITWWQRVAVALDVTLLWIVWPSIARGQITKIRWRDLPRRIAVAIKSLIHSRPPWAAISPVFRSGFWRNPGYRTTAMAASASFLVFSLVFAIATFPGEWLYKAPSFQFVPWKHKKDNPQDDDTWERKSLHELLVAGDVDFGARRAKSLWSNRLMLPDFDVIDHTKYDSEEKIANLETTVSLRVRHLEGAVLIGAKLRKADFTGAWLQGARLDDADLREAKFDCADTWRECAQLQGASFQGAQLLGVSLVRAELQGEVLAGAQLQGAKLLGAHLQGATLSSAQLQGATLDSAQLQAASLGAAHLQGAVLDRAQLQGADLSGAHLQGASLDSAQLQGAVLEGTQLRAASLNNVFVWRTDARKSIDADAATIIADPTPDMACPQTEVDGPCVSMPVWIKYLQEIANNVTDSKTRPDAIRRMARLDPAYHLEDEDDIARHWAMLNKSSALVRNRGAMLVQQLQMTGCTAEGSPYVFRQLLDRFGAFDTKEATKLAEAFLDDQHCPGAKRMTEAEKAKLEQIRQDDISP